MKRILISITAGMLCLAMVFLCGCGSNAGKDNETEKTEKVVWSEKTELTSVMYGYFLNAYFRSFSTTYESQLSLMGIDTEKDLNEQYYDEASGQTWYSYIAVQTYNEVAELLAIYDESKEIGYELSDKAKEAIDTTISRYEKEAAGYAKEPVELYEAMFGEGMTEEILRFCLEIQAVSSEYFSDVYEVPEFTIEDKENFCSGHKNDFLFFDCITAVVPNDEDAEKLSGCTDKESFISALRTIITDNNFGGDYESYKDQIDSILENKTTKRNAYSSTNEFVVWAFEEGRKPYETWSKKDDASGKTTVEMLLPAEGTEDTVVYKDEEPVRNILYALVTDADEAKSEYDSWVSSGAKQEDFEAIVKKYDGGRAININKNSFVPVLNDWVFDPENVEGAHAMIGVEGEGTYLMYMLEKGDPSWMVDAEKALEDNAYQEHINSLCEKHTVQYNGDLIYNVPIMTFSTSANNDAVSEG